MAFQDKIEILIDSIFDGTGFDDFKKSVKSLQDRVETINTTFKNARGIEKLTSEARELSSELEKVGLQFSEVADKQEALRKGGGPTREAARAMDRGGVFQDRATGETVPETETTQRLADVDRGLPQALNNIKETNPLLAELRQNTGNVNNAFSRFDLELEQSNERMNEGQGQVRGFRFELLGLMFAGMALQRVMFGLLRPAFEAAGVFDLMGSILQFMFLPVALDVLDVILDNQDAIFDLGEDTRRTIGYLVAAAGALGFLAFVGGQAGLAFDSMLIFFKEGSLVARLLTGAFGKLSGAITTLTGVGAGKGLLATLGSLITGLSAPMLAVAAIVVGAAALIITNFEGIRDALTEFLASMSPFIDQTGRLLETFANFFLNSIGRGLEAIGMLGEGFSELWSAIVAPIIQALGSSIIIVMNLFRKGFEGMLDIAKDFANGLADILGPVIESVSEEIAGFVNGARNVLSMLPGVSFEGGDAESENIDVDTGEPVSEFFTGVASNLGLGAETNRQIRAFNNLVDTTGDVGAGLGSRLAGVGRDIQRTDINLTQNIDARSESAQESPQSRARRTGREAERGATNALNRTAGGR